VIKFTNVFKAFPKGGLALKDVSFHVAKGELAFSPATPAPASRRS